MSECRSCDKCCCPCHKRKENACCPCHAKNGGCCKNGSCAERSCNEEAFCGDLLEVADLAWMEVLKEKIKDHIKTHQSDRMNELAKVVSEANNLRWKNKMEKKHECKDFKERICRFFGYNK